MCFFEVVFVFLFKKILHDRWCFFFFSFFVLGFLRVLEVFEVGEEERVRRWGQWFLVCF